jgi:hypothetical protein
VIVFGIYNHTSDGYAAAAEELQDIRLASQGWHNTRVLVLLITHLSLRKQDRYSRKMGDPKLTLYPINTLRNLVIDQAQTNWVFPLDVDFIPSATLYSRMVKVYLPRLAEVERPAIVVPHFETLPNTIAPGIQRIPSDFDELKSALMEGSVVPFHSHPNLLMPAFNMKPDYNRSWPQGLAPSNYSQWYVYHAMER